jgi:hypothetical protein
MWGILGDNEFKEDGETGEFDSSDDRRAGSCGSSVSTDVGGVRFWQADASSGQAVFGFGSWWLSDRAGFRCLLLQYVEDLSDRQMERCLAENLAAKLFCGFELMDQTPDFSYFIPICNH